MGKKRLAQMLARAGLHLGVTTVGRMLKEDDGPLLPPRAVLRGSQEGKRAYKPVNSKYPDHVWLVDLTVVPTSAGFWVPWMPFRHAAGVAVVLVDRVCCGSHLATGRGLRGVLEATLVDRHRGFLGRAIRHAGKAPKYLISDKGGQFTAPGFTTWCRGEEGSSLVTLPLASEERLLSLKGSGAH